jgi:hypothetical protein
MISIKELFKILLTIFLFPFVSLIIFMILVLSIHYFIYEALWQNKESKD